MNILFCGDSNAEDGVLITTLSLLNHVNELHIYILTMKTKNKKRISILLVKMQLILSKN